ncbi:hypothetical protein MPTK2_4g07170 [Marchantia polymorpha subsp. ruderalis]
MTFSSHFGTGANVQRRSAIAPLRHSALSSDPSWVYPKSQLRCSLLDCLTLTGIGLENNRHDRDVKIEKQEDKDNTNRDCDCIVDFVCSLAPSSTVHVFAHCVCFSGNPLS